MTKENINVLTQPKIPLALHGINPRTIMGDYKWNKLKKEWQQKADHHCMACDAYISHTPGDWMELHERYQYNFDTCTQRHTGYIILCNKCHAYIHQGRLQILVAEGQVSQEKYLEIILHGDNLLKKAHLKKIPMSKEELVNPHWELEFNGRLYDRFNFAQGGEPID